MSDIDLMDTLGQRIEVAVKGADDDPGVRQALLVKTNEMLAVKG